jgi:hypothetical protein
MFARTALLAALLLAARSPAGETHELETDYYRLIAEGPRERAEELGRVLDATWTGCKAYFKKKPKVSKGAKLVVRFLESRKALEEAVRADGGTPAEGAEGHYEPANETAYACKQLGRYETRLGLVRQAVRQFHFLARARNERPKGLWYADGIAEFLATHFWDGRKLELGVRPLVSPTDHGAKALEALRGPDFDLSKLVNGEMAPTRPLSWALVRYLATGNNGKPLKKWSAFAKKMDGGVAPEGSFKRHFGRPADLQEPFLIWLDREQEPWAPVFDEWYSTSADSIRGTAESLSACRLKAKAELLQFTLIVPKNPRARWLGGVLLHFSSPRDFSVALLDWAGYIRVYRKSGGGKQTLAQGEGPGTGDDGNYHIQVFRKGANVYLMIGTLSYGPWELPGDTIGLALDRCTLDFTDLNWR